MRSTPLEAARRVVFSRAWSVSLRVERVRDCEAARRRVCGMLNVSMGMVSTVMGQAFGFICGEKKMG